MIETTTVTPTTPLRDLGYRQPQADPNANDLDKDAFLQLLVAQLRYQDPLNPNDPAEFMATTAQFTVVEKLDQLTQQGANTAIISGLSMASSLVGRTVTYLGADDNVTTGVVSSAQVSNGEVRLVTDNGIVDLSSVIGIGATDGQPTPSGPQATGPTTPVVKSDTSGGSTSEEASNAAAAAASDAVVSAASDIPVVSAASDIPVVSAASDIPVVSTLPGSPLAIPPSLSSSRPDQPTIPPTFTPTPTDPATNPATPPLSNTEPASDTNTTKEFTS